MKPVVDYFYEHFKDNKLDESFSLDDYRHNADEKGIDDGWKEVYSTFISNMETDRQQFDFITQNLYLNDLEDIPKAVRRINDYYHEDTDRFAVMIADSISEYIAQNAEEIDARRLFQLGTYLLFESEELEAVKIAIVLLSSFDWEAEEEAIHVLTDLAFCEEFTMYVDLYVLSDLPEANMIRWQIIRNLKGWGKVFMSFSLKPESREMEDWLLMESWKTDVGNSLVAPPVFLYEKLDFVNIITQDATEERLAALGEVISMIVNDENDIKDEVIHDRKLIDALINSATPLPCLFALNDIKDELESEGGNEELIETVLQGIDRPENQMAVEEAMKDHPDSGKFMDLMGLVYVMNYDFSDTVYELVVNEPLKYCSGISYLLESKHEFDLVDALETPVDLDRFTGEPEALMGGDELSWFLTQLMNYSHLGIEYVVAGLNSRFVNVRKTALEVIESWIDIDDDIESFDQRLLEALMKLKDHEVVRELKEKINNILDVEEDLEFFRDAEIRYLS